MKSLTMSLVCLAALLVVGTVAQQPRQYTDKFDNVNVDQVLGNDRILSNYIRCLLDKGPCTQEGRELKKTLPDALRSNCEKCSEKQKNNSRKVISHLETKKPAEWKKLLEKYDPEGIYKSKFEKLNKRS